MSLNGLTMLPPSVKGHLEKNTTPGMRSPSFELLVKVVQDTSKTLQAVVSALR